MVHDLNRHPFLHQACRREVAARNQDGILPLGQPLQLLAAVPLEVGLLDRQGPNEVRPQLLVLIEERKAGLAGPANPGVVDQDLPLPLRV